jgi:transposase, IS30 family
MKNKQKTVTVAVRKGVKQPLLTMRERSIIEIRYTKDNWNITQIAAEIGKHKSTVSRELKGKNRSGRNKYRADVANVKACERIEKRGNKSKISKDSELEKYIIEKLMLGWSPEQISGRIKKDYPLDITMHISYEAIYQYVYKQYYRNGNGSLKKESKDLRQYLPRRHTRRVTKGGRAAQKLERRTSLPSIEDRPEIVDLRTRIGDWEDDFVVSRESVSQVKSINERRSGVHFFRKTTGRTATDGDIQVVDTLKDIPQEYLCTLTRDRGAENMKYLELQKNLNIEVYFAHAYCSQERGSNENGNGLLRRYFPKKTNWDMISEEELSRVEYLINTRPRKRLGWLSPVEYFYQETGVALFV